MPLLDVVILLLAGFAAGAINAVVGSGTLITFPALLLLGYPALVANVSNTIGLVAGGVGAIRGYRGELVGQGAILARLLPASIAGAITGAVLLLVLPAAAFEAIVPALIAVALVLVVAGPAINRNIAAGREDAVGRGAGAAPETDTAGTAAVAPRAASSALPGGPASAVVVGGIFVAGVYGGYFGAAQGVLLLGLMSALIVAPLQRINAFKNVLGTAVNAVAAIVFLLVARDEVDLAVVVVIALGALAGGFVGGRLGRRIPPAALRGVIVLVGTAAIVNLLVLG